QVVASAAAHNAELRTAEREGAIEERRLGVWKGGGIPHAGASVGGGCVRARVVPAVPLFDRNQGQIKGSLARGEQARLKRDALRRSVEARAFAAHARAAAQRAQVAPYRDTLVPTATTIESLAEEGYRLGRSPVLAVLDAQRTLRAAEGEYVSLLLSRP